MIIPFFHGSKDKHPASGMAADALFQSTFEHAPIGLAVVSLSGEFKQVNPAICEILGHTEAELLATNFVRITHPSDIDADMGWISRLLNGELDRYHMDKRYIRAVLTVASATTGAVAGVLVVRGNPASAPVA